MFGGVPRGFSVGSVSVDAAAHVSRQSFTEAGKAYEGVSRHARIAGDIVKDVMERMGRAQRGHAVEAKTSSESVIKSLGGISDSAMRTGKATRVELDKSGRAFGGLAEASSVSARKMQEADAKSIRSAELRGKAERAEIEKTRKAMAGGSGFFGGGGNKAARGAEEAGENAAKHWKKGFDKLANAGKWSILGGLGIAGLSVKAAADFEKTMEMIHTQAGYSQKDVERLGKQVEALAPTVGIGPKKLAEGLFHLASAGIEAGKSMEILTKAAELAKVGNSSMDETTYALVSLLKTAPKDIHSTAEAVGVMNDIVGQGDMRMKDLVRALSSGIVPAAKAVGLGLRDTGAALDILTARGVPAEEAATRLRTSLGLVAHPTAKAMKALSELGIQHDTLARSFEHHGLASTLEFLQKQLDKTFPKGHSLSVEETKAAMEKYRHTLEETGVTGKKEGVALEMFEKKLKESGTAAIQQSSIIAEAFGGARIGTTWQILMQNIDDVRKHQDKLNAPGGAERFQKSWEATEKTFSAKASKMWAAVQKIGIEIGVFLIPRVEKLFNLLGEAGKWIGQHKLVLEALAIAIGGFITAAIVAFFAKWVLGIRNTFKEVNALINKLVGMPATVQPAVNEHIAQIDMEAAAWAKVKAELTAYQEQAMRPTAPGGILPGRGVQARGPGGKFMSYEATAASMAYPPQTRDPATGRFLPYTTRPVAAAPVGGAVINEAALAQEISSPGVAAKLKSLSGKLVGGLMRGGMIASFGAIAAEIGGSALGLGKTEQHAATGVALGAGFGSIFGPGGMIAGGVLGGLVGGFNLFDHKAESEGERVGKKAAKGMAKPIGESLSKELGEADKLIRNAEEETKKPSRGLAGPADPAQRKREEAGAPPSKPVREVAGQLQTAAGEKFGRAIVQEQLAQTIGKGMGGRQAITSIIMEMTKRLNELPEAARAAGGHAIIELVKQLEHDKKLPAKSVHEVVVALGQEFPKMKKYAEQAGKESMKALAASQEGKQVLAKAGIFMDNLRNVYKEFEKFPAITSENALELFRKANAKLEKEEKTGNANKRLAAKEDREALKKQEEKWYGDRLKNIDARLASLNKSNSKHTQKGNEETALLFEARALIIEEKMKAGVTSSKTAAKELNEDFIKEMKALGVSPAEVKKMEQGLGKAVGTTGKEATKAIKGLFAVGGIPNPGAGSGDDHVLYDPHGNPVAALSGTEGVVNRPQMGVINSALQVTKAMGVMPYGSLDDLWSSGMKHYAGGGGLAKNVYTNPMPGLRLGRTDMGVDFEGKGPIYAIGDSLIKRVSPQDSGTGWPGEGDGGHGNKGAMIVYQLLKGPDSGKYIYTAENIDPVKGLHPGMTVHEGQQIASARGKFPFLETGFSDASGTPISAHEYTEGKVTRGGQAFLSFLGEVGVGHYSKTSATGSSASVKEPKWKGPGGTVGVMGKSIIKKITHAANARLARISSEHEPTTGESGENIPAGKLGPANKVEFARYLAQFTGLPARFLLAWMNHEQGATTVEGGNNWLNIETGGPGGGSGPHGATAKWVERHNPKDAAKIEDQWLRKNLPQLLGARNAVDAVRILEASGYAESHYNYESPSSFLKAAGFAGGGLLRRLAGGGTPSVRRGGTGPTGTNQIGRHPRNPYSRSQHKIHPSSGGRKTPAGTRRSPNKKAPGTPKVKPGTGGGHHKKYHATGPKHHKPQLVAGEEYTGLPDSIINIENELKLPQEKIGEYETDYSYAQEDYSRPPTPESLVTLTDADVAVIDPAGHNNAKGEFIPGPTGYQPGDQIVNRDGMTVGRFFGPKGPEGGSFVPGVSARMEQIHNLLGILGMTGGQYGEVTRIDESLVGPLGKAGSRYSGGGLEGREIEKRKAAIKKFNERIDKVKKRKARIEGFKNRNKLRIEKLRKRIAEITSSSLSANLKKALSQAAANERKHELSAHREDLHNELTAEKKYQSGLLLPREKDPGHEEALHGALKSVDHAIAQENSLSSKISGKSSIGKAEEAILKNNLKNQIETLTVSDTHFGERIKDDEIEIKNLQKKAKTQQDQQNEIEKDQPVHTEDLKTIQGQWHTLNANIQALHDEEGSLGRAANIQPRPQKDVKKESEETAKKAYEDLAALDAASSQLFQQFGSNTMSSAQLPAALAGGISRGGVRFFGAAGGQSAAVGITPSSTPSSVENKTFEQHNHYLVGPQNPHIHAQESHAEFAARMG